MPAKDKDHDVVVRCLTKSGWMVLSEQEYISVGAPTDVQRRLYIDIKAQSADETIVLIEVKALDRSPVHQLMELIGQYLVYREALDYLGINIPLYVAIPKAARDGIFQHIIGQQLMEKYAIPLVIYDPEQEVILEWIPQP